MNIRKRIESNNGHKVIIHEGVTFVVSDEEICPGDPYLAERNSGPKLLTCRYVNKDLGWIVPLGFGYLFDIRECIKVVDLH